jgi:hypothetical protein
MEVWGLGEEYAWGPDGSAQDLVIPLSKTGSKTGYRDEETRTYTVTGHGEAFEHLEKVMKAMSILGGWGASREVKVWFDGDGSDKLSVAELEDSTLKGFNTESDVVDLSGTKLVPRDKAASRVASRWMQKLVKQR